MKKFFIIALTALCTMSCANINANQRKGETFTVATGTTQISSELKAFEHLSVGSSLDVKFVQSDRYHIEIHGDEKDLRNINYTNENGIFDIWVNTAEDKDGKRWKRESRELGKISITIHGKNLKSTSAHGASKISIDLLQCANPKISNSGASTTNITKLVANEVSINNSGASITNIAKLDAKEACINNSGASIANITKLTATETEIDNTGASITNITKLTATETEIDNSGASFATLNEATAERLGISNSGASKCQIAGLNGTNVRIENNGASKCQIAGTATKATISCSGKSNVDADNLKCATVNVKATGESHVSVYASKEIIKKTSEGSSCETRGDGKIIELR